MPTVNIKPLSVNDAWQGRRYKTPKYKAYERDVLLSLPRTCAIPEGNIRLLITAGLSSKQSDIDNIAKPFIDILQKKYGFNDSQIYRLEMDKVIVPKGKEFITFDLKACSE